MGRGPRAGLLAPIAALALLAATPAPAEAVRPLDADWRRGAVVPAFHDDTYLQRGSDRALRALRRTGSTHVTLFLHWYMRGPRSSRIAPHREETPTDRSVRHAMRKARSLGMSVTLSPVARPRDSWQGSIHPSNLARWFRSYRDMIGHYARLAEAGGADTLVIGAEHRSVSRHTKRWREVVAVARRRFSGELTYLANHVAEASKVRFWDDLDHIAISAYMPLSNQRNPSVSELVQAWFQRGYVSDIRGLYEQWDLPVVFGEIGYQSRMGTAAQPWADGSGAISQGPQRRAYEAAYRVWSRFDWFDGIYWWRWLPGRHDDRDGTHSPRGKKAEATMRAWHTAR